MRLYDGTGRVRAVTAIELGPNRVTQLRTGERDGYEAVQIGHRGDRKRLNRPARGHLRQAGVEEALSVLREFRIDDASEFSVGEELRVDRFIPRDVRRCHRHLEGPGVRRRRKALGLPRGAENPRPVRQAPRARLDRRRHHARQGVEGPEDGRAHGRAAKNGARPAGRAHRCEPQPDPRRGLRARSEPGDGDREPRPADGATGVPAADAAGARGAAEEVEAEETNDASEAAVEKAPSAQAPPEEIAAGAPEPDENGDEAESGARG